MAKNIAVSSHFAQNSCIPGLQQETLYLFVKILLGVEITFLEYIEFIHVSKYCKFHPKIKQGYQNATAWVIFS